MGSIGAIFLCPNSPFLRIKFCDEGLNFNDFFHLFRNFFRSIFSQTNIDLVVPSNQNQLLATCKCSDLAAECLLLGTISGCGEFLLSSLVIFAAVDYQNCFDLLDCTNSMRLIVMLFLSSIVL